MDGVQPAGTIGGDSLADLLAEARRDDQVKAVVLRVDSPGGSAFAAEQIRAELLALKQAGKPVVISMGSYAASGGYWISADADKIFASPPPSPAPSGCSACSPPSTRRSPSTGYTPTASAPPTSWGRADPCPAGSRG